MTLLNTDVRIIAGVMRFVILVREDPHAALFNNLSIAIQHLRIEHSDTYRGSAEVVIVAGIRSDVVIAVEDCLFTIIQTYASMFLISMVQRGLTLRVARCQLRYGGEYLSFIHTPGSTPGDVVQGSIVQLTDFSVVSDSSGNGCLGVVVGEFLATLTNVSMTLVGFRMTLRAAFHRLVFRFTMPVEGLQMSVRDLRLDESSGGSKNRALLSFDGPFVRSFIVVTDVWIEWPDHLLWLTFSSDVIASTITLIHAVDNVKLDSGLIHRSLQFVGSVVDSTVIISDMNMTFPSGTDASGFLLIIGGNLTRSIVVVHQTRITCIQECFVASLRNYLQASSILLDHVTYQTMSSSVLDATSILVGWGNHSVASGVPTGDRIEPQPTSGDDAALLAAPIPPPVIAATVVTVRCVSEVIVAHVFGFSEVVPCSNVSIPTCTTAECALQAVVPSRTSDGRRCRRCGMALLRTRTVVTRTLTPLGLVTASASMHAATRSRRPDAGDAVSSAIKVRRNTQDAVVASKSFTRSQRETTLATSKSATVFVSGNSSTVMMIPIRFPANVTGYPRRPLRPSLSMSVVVRHDEIIAAPAAFSTAVGFVAAFAAIASTQGGDVMWLSGMAVYECNLRHEPTGLLILGLLPVGSVVGMSRTQAADGVSDGGNASGAIDSLLRAWIVSCLVANFVALSVGTSLLAAIYWATGRKQLRRRMASASVGIDAPSDLLNAGGHQDDVPLLRPPPGGVAVSSDPLHRSSAAADADGTASLLFPQAAAACEQVTPRTIIAAAGLPSTVLTFLGPTADPLLAAAFALLIGFPIDPSSALALQIVAAVCVVGGFAVFVAFIGRAVVTRSMIFVPSRGMSRMPEWLRVSGRWEDPESPAAFVAFSAMYGPLFARLRAGSLPGRWDRGHVLAELTLAAIGSCLRGALQPRGMCVALSVCNVCIALAYVGLAATMPRSVKAVSVSRLLQRLLAVCIVVLTAGSQVFGWSSTTASRTFLVGALSVWRLGETVVVALLMRRAKWEQRKQKAAAESACHRLLVSPPLHHVATATKSGIVATGSEKRPRDGPGVVLLSYEQQRGEGELLNPLLRLAAPPPAGLIRTGVNDGTTLRHTAGFK